MTVNTISGADKQKDEPSKLAYVGSSFCLSIARLRA